MSDDALVGGGIFPTHFSVKNTSFSPKPGVNLAHKENQIVKTTGIFSLQMLYPNLILGISRIHKLCPYPGKQNNK